MARQSGVIKFTGSLGDVSGYKDGQGNHIIRTKGGATAEQIATGENFARTRENMAEFSGVSKMGKYIRDAMAATKRSWDRYVTGRLVAQLKQVNLLDDSEARGQRAILVTAAPEALVGFQFNSGSNLDSVLRVPFTVTANAGRNEATFEVPAVDPGVNLAVPSGATHVRYICAAMALPDFIYNEGTGQYEPAADVATLLTVIHSSYLDLGSAIAATDVVAALPGSPTMAPEVSLCAVIGVQYYQEVSGNYYPFAQQDAIKIGGVFA